MQRATAGRSLLCVAACVAIISACRSPSVPPANDVEGWAVLAEKDDYDNLLMSDMLVDYVDILRMRQALEQLGWSPDHIRELREFDRGSLGAELNWLAGVADENDIAILYVSAHGSYLSDVLGWSSLVPDLWTDIRTPRRLLVVDACTAADFTNDLAGDPGPLLSVASVGEDQFGWRGLEEEGLPIIGSVFTFYFGAALNDPNADTNGDRNVSAQEAAQRAEVQQRAYLHDVVLVVPEFVEMFHALGISPEDDPGYPRVVMQDTLGEQLPLALNAYH